MTYTTIAARPEIPAGPPKLTPRQLSSEQAETLDAPRLRYSLLARALFTTMDLAYGRTRTIVKFAMLEFIARVPYQAWERMGYLTLARYRDHHQRDHHQRDHHGTHHLHHHHLKPRTPQHGDPPNSMNVTL